MTWLYEKYRMHLQTVIREDTKKELTFNMRNADFAEFSDELEQYKNKTVTACIAIDASG